MGEPSRDGKPPPHRVPTLQYIADRYRTKGSASSSPAISTHDFGLWFMVAA